MKSNTVVRFVFFCLVLPAGMLVFNGLFARIYPTILSDGYLATIAASLIVGLLLYVSVKVLQIIQTDPARD